MDRRLSIHITTVAALGLFFLPLHPLVSGPLILAMILAGSDPAGRRRLGMVRPAAVDWLLMPILIGLTVGAGILVPVAVPPVPAGSSADWLISVPSVLSAAISEEMLFRSLILSVYAPLFGTVPAVLVSSALFAVGHFYQGWPAAGFALAVGVLYSAVFLKRRNFWILAAAHGIHNLLALPLPGIR